MSITHSATPKKSDSEVQKQSSKGYAPLFSPDFKADLRWWYQNKPKMGDKIMDLVADILYELQKRMIRIRRGGDGVRRRPHKGRFLTKQ